MSELPSLQELAERFIFGPVPHHRALGLRFVSADVGKAEIELPYSPELVGDPSTGVLHGGAITTLLDTVSGCAVFTALKPLRRVATLDLRIDYMRPAEAGKDIRASAECYRVTKQIAFVRAIAHDGDPARPVATSAGTFNIFESKSKPKEAG